MVLYNVKDMETLLPSSLTIVTAAPARRCSCIAGDPSPQEQQLFAGDHVTQQNGTS
jgi:hypothetical protein